ncbi:hypothetical protein [Dyadobacter sp. BHUBP1]|uniref:hypothetical protein n=1 Tax=Dyadobacter sp. BHUBP1 TaxID=3424178 RepID=UPI003D328603
MSTEEFYKFKENLANELSVVRSMKISDRDVMDALYLLYADNADMEWIGDIWDLEITYDHALTDLLKFDFGILSRFVEIDESKIPSDFVTKKKARFKHKGTVWVIHRYDADPFPSIPHAHNMELNHKLDLSTGKCYEKRQLIYIFSKRDLLEIRERASKVYLGQLPELYI